ncbi:MAG: flavin reductase family protein [Desulfobacterota bacterium]|nr:flavin reductase family protein [Thermodesulfobacteriota bacterium]
MNKKKIGPTTLLYPMPAILVGATVDNKPNFMTAAWCGIAAHKPPALTVALQQHRYTLKGIKEYQNFSVNVPSVSLIKKVDYCGIYSGAKKDKTSLFKIFYGPLKTAPLIEECPVNLECQLKNSVDLGSHVLLIGEIVETYVNEDCFKEGKPDPERIDPLIFIPSVHQYHCLGEFLAKAFAIGKE